MEDVKPSISSSSGYDGGMGARLRETCENVLGLESALTRHAMVLCRDIEKVMEENWSDIANGEPKDVERFWCAFILCVVTRMSRGNDEDDNSGVTLSEILRTYKISVVAFFKEISQFTQKAGHVLASFYGSDWEKKLKLMELQTNFVYLGVLNRYFRRIYLEFFTGNNSCQGSTISSSSVYVSDFHRFGWLLFLALRTHAFSRVKDLVTCTNGLVTILAVLILHVPVRFRTFDIQDSKLLSVKSDKGINLLASLCNIYQTSEEDMRIIMEKTNSLIVDMLKKEPCPAKECKSENLDYIVPDAALVYFEGLLDESSLLSSSRILEKDYDDTTHMRGELDERMFVNEEDSLLGSKSLSGGSINMYTRKEKLNHVTSPSRAPPSPDSHINCKNSSHHPVVTNTPVSTAMTTAKWLREVISPLPSTPSAALQLFLSSCDRDLNAEVTRRAIIVLGVMFPCSLVAGERTSGTLQCTSLNDSIWAEHRKMESLKLYYRVLEAMCKAEAEILNTKNLTVLLANERFHRCMLACSAELVVATHMTVTMLLPTILERAGITAFDMGKVVESFIRHEETLPRDLKRHLNQLEERLLESMAWEKGSSMYNSLIVARPDLSAEIHRLKMLAEPMPSLDDMVNHYGISTEDLPPLPTRKREHMPDEDGDPRTPKKQCTLRRNVLVERNSFSSPVKERHLASDSLKLNVPLLQSAFASPSRPNPARTGETCAETGVKVFFNKLVRLAAFRIRTLSEKLQFPRQSLERVYCLVQQIINHRTALLFNRHIDQIILCSFYGIAKISNMGLTFKEIISHYRKLPQSKPHVFRNVFVNWPTTSRNGKLGEDRIDIITFYNDVFIPSVKPLLVELASHRVAQEDKKPIEDIKLPDRQMPGSPRLCPFPNLPDMSPMKVCPAHNVYVSPLRVSKVDGLLSPSSKSYYACIGESTHSFQSPSKDLAAINNHLNSARKVNTKLSFDLVSDSVVAGSLSDVTENQSSPSADASKKVKRKQPES